MSPSIVHCNPYLDTNKYCNASRELRSDSRQCALLDESWEAHARQVCLHSNHCRLTHYELSSAGTNILAYS